MRCFISREDCGMQHPLKRPLNKLKSEILKILKYNVQNIVPVAK